MRKMKSSGVEWIGEIPENWKTVKVKQAFVRKNEKAKQENPVILSLARTGVKVRDVSTNEGQVAESYYNYNPVSVGDLLLNPMDLYSGANCSISDVEGVISPAYVNLRSRNGYYSKFYDYYFKAQYWMMVLFAHGKGVSFDNRWTLNNETLMNFPIVSPDYDTQHRIADFLDDKCGKIDRYIEKQQQIIDKLKEYKQAVITEAVTKGLNPDAPMKDSGIEWIGMIPEHWEVKKFGYIATVKANLVHPNAYGDYPQVSSENIEKSTGRLLKCKTVNDVGVISDNHLFFKGQILYSKIRPALNKACIAPFDGLCSADIYPIETMENTEFVLFSILSESFLEQVRTLTETRVKMPKINQNELSGIISCVPPLDEQNKIVAYINRKMKLIDLVLVKKERILEKLTEYKKSLIYEAVTGKMEV